jgi:hypothetical protein
MKTKGITFWERYLEYFVLGAAVLVLLTFAALQFLGNPNSVDVPGVGKVGPSQVDSLLEQRATEISQKIGGAGIDIPAPAPVLPRFQEGKMADINPGGALFVSRPRLSPVSGIVVVQRDRPFVVPSIPAPHNLVAQQYFDTLSEETMTDHAELRQIVASAPYDITWITPAATFDVSSVRRQFGEPGPNGEAPLPLKWYNNRVEFIDVKVERQELVNG